MTYRLKTNNPKIRTLIVIILIVILIVGFRFLFPYQWSRMVIGSSSFLNIGSFVSNIKISQETDALKKQISDLSVRLNDRNALEQENVILREMVGRNEKRNSVLAVVLSKPTITPYDTFIIDIGSNYGIQTNSLVLIGSSTAVGLVTEVYPNFSKVTAYSSPGSKHSVFIGEKNIQAEAIGQGNGNFKIVLPESTDIKQGDSVILPNIIPTVFGTVEKIVPSGQPSFVNVLFKNPVNLNELYYVEVVK